MNISVVGGGQQVIGLVAILQTEDVIAVLLPAMGGLVGFARQQGREVHFLGADAVDLLADDASILFSTRRPSGSQVQIPGAALRI